jgi:hypothetical protein
VQRTRERRALFPSTCHCFLLSDIFPPPPLQEFISLEDKTAPCSLPRFSSSAFLGYTAGNGHHLTQKTNPCVWGKACQSATQATPPPHAAWIWRHSNAKSGCPNETPEWGGGGGGECRVFQITQQRSKISRCFFHTKVCSPFLLRIGLTNCPHLLFACLASKNGVLYSEGRAYKRAPELGISPQSTALHSTGNTSVKNSVHKNTTAHVE